MLSEIRRSRVDKLYRIPLTKGIQSDQTCGRREHNGGYGTEERGICLAGMMSSRRTRHL